MTHRIALPAPIGAPFEGGFHAGLIRIDNQLHALIVAPKFDGEHDATPWNAASKLVAGATSWHDGRANTLAMAAAGSALAQWALDLRIGGHDDWYLPSQDELELLYRHFKPTAQANWCYARSGINLSAEPPTRPYVPALPAQTALEAFRAGGTEAFEPAWYWSSTQHASDAGYAWYQSFYDGSQNDTLKYNQLRARAVRRLPI